ncbi:tectonin domain-containing protein [Streptomyces atroolivaceus]
MWGVTHDASPWENVAGSLSDIGAAADGTVWGVNSGGSIYRYTGDQPS